MSKFDLVAEAIAMAIVGYASMSLIGSFAEFPALRREPSARQSRLGIDVPQGDRSAAAEDSMSQFGIIRISESEYDVTTEKSGYSSTDSIDDMRVAARVEPSFRDGKCDGFRFVSMTPDSIYAALGFRSGDVVHVVNGFPMCSPELTLTAYQHWREARYLEVEFERRGAILKRRYWLH